jgi:hypothetical protein
MAHAPSRSMHQLVSYRDMTNAASSGSTSKTRPTGTISIGIFQDYGLAHSHIGANKKNMSAFHCVACHFLVGAVRYRLQLQH